MNALREISWGSDVWNDHDEAGNIKHLNFDDSYSMLEISIPSEELASSMQEADVLPTVLVTYPQWHNLPTQSGIVLSFSV
jgi:hypothetical protein